MSRPGLWVAGVTFLALSVACAAHAAALRPWELTDIVDVSDITDVAIEQHTHRVAYIVKRARVATGDITYSLYVLDSGSRAVPREIATARYIGGLSWHPGTDRWTVRALFDDAIQLYDLDAVGNRIPLVTVSESALVGANDGLISDSVSRPDPTGVLSYQWADDGSALWYARMRLSPLAERSRMAERGIVYDDATMNLFSFRREDQRLLGEELRVFVPESRQDRLLGFAATLGIDDGLFFQSEYGSTAWLPDSRHIRYVLEQQDHEGRRQFVPWVADIDSGVSTRDADGPAGWGLMDATAVGHDGQSLVLKQEDSGRRLLRYDRAGAVIGDYGLVPYRRFVAPKSAWEDRRRGRSIVAVHYRDHNGLVTVPASPAGKALAQSDAHLTHCDFSKDMERGVCVRQSLTQAPQLVEVSAATGAISVIADPNQRYAEIKPLHSEHVEWTNKYGNINDGFVTFPRGYVSGTKYPAIVVTHASDALNRFADGDFQWEFPVQVFAERGYLVLSVNEAAVRRKTDAVFMTNKSHSDVSLDDWQLEMALEPVASMEAALQWSIDKGWVDPQKTGICGYSRGAAVTEYTMALSKLFKVGSDGDGGGMEAGTFWSFGSKVYRDLYRDQFGGPPFDPVAWSNYRRLAPSARMDEFAGPLLQQLTAGAGPMALEMHAVMEDAAIPTELAFYPRESHIFWHPRHRLFAMQRNLEWFDYWLLDKRSNNPVDPTQYARWDTMAAAWKAKVTPRPIHAIN